MWIGTGDSNSDLLCNDGGGVAKFDGSNWVFYDVANSGLPSNCITCVTVDNNGNKWFGTKGLSGGVAVYNQRGVRIPVEIRDFYLKQNYPNPFRSATVITYVIPTPENVEIVIYDGLGRKVKTLFNGHRGRGVHRVLWDATDDNGRKVVPGVYYCAIWAGKYYAVKKMVLLR